MRFQAVNRCLMASVWWVSDFRLSTLRALGLILVAPPMADGASARRGRYCMLMAPFPRNTAPSWSRSARGEDLLLRGKEYQYLMVQLQIVSTNTRNYDGNIVYRPSCEYARK